MIVLSNRSPSQASFLARFDADSILSRIWSHDASVWKRDAADIVHRLGWLHTPETMQLHVDRIERFASSIAAEGFRDVVLLGMGGSSLAAETLVRAFGPSPGKPRVQILDSTHPDAIRRVEASLDLDRTLCLVATKSGTTAETLALYRYFQERIAGNGVRSPGSRFAAISDPGSPLVDLAARDGFRETFLNDPAIGGRYAALSLFGLVPAALAGIDVRRLLERGREAAVRCAKYGSLDENPAVQLGIFLGSWAAEGRDKATFLISSSLRAFGDWVEQLLAESTGKQGTGIVPVVDEPAAAPDAYGDDRVFIHVRRTLDPTGDALEIALRDAGHPVACLEVESPEGLGEQFFVWELATAIAGYVLGINPFDQPNVEQTKAFTRSRIEEFQSTGTRPELHAEPLSPHIFQSALRRVAPTDYVALHAYVPPSPETTEAVRALRVALRRRYGIATTFGYGPRFLHSTGQLHKGDRGNGHFIQLVTEPEHDLEIPAAGVASHAPLSFGVLIAAQAAGDRQALLSNGRSVTTLRVGTDVAAALASLGERIE